MALSIPIEIDGHHTHALYERTGEGVRVWLADEVRCEAYGKDLGAALQELARRAACREDRVA